MPAKTVVCVICGKEVTKKSTLDLSVLSPGQTGRGCRNHEEVKALESQKPPASKKIPDPYPEVMTTVERNRWIEDRMRDGILKVAAENMRQEK
jgi:hypothetical protein